MIHRHSEVPADVPAEELPLVAIADILDRGDLEDWQPLARAIHGDPFGRLATAVARLVDAYPRYGTSPLWRAWIDRCRVRAQAAPAAEQVAPTAQPVTLAALRRELCLTQEQVARRLRMTQSDVSKLERRTNARLSTLQAYAHSLGGSLLVTFVNGEKTCEIRLSTGPPGPSQRNSASRMACASSAGTYRK